MDSITYKPWAIIKISLFIIFTAFITFTIWLFSLKILYLDKFEDIRCKLHFLPLISFINPDISVSKNFNYCISKQSTDLIEKENKKLNEPIKNVVDIQNHQTEQTIQLKKVSKNIQDTNVENMRVMGNVFERIEIITQYIGEKIYNFFYKITAAFITTFYLLIASMNTFSIMFASILKTIIIVYVVGFMHFLLGIIYLISYVVFQSAQLYPAAAKSLYSSKVHFAKASVMLGVAGTVSALNKSAENRSKCCMSPDSIVLDENKKEIRMDHCQLNQELFGFSKIFGIIVSQNNSNLVELPGNMWLTKNHFILENQKWILAEDSINSKTTNKKSKQVISFVTSNHKIHSKNFTLSDYEETYDYESVSRIIDKSLNKYPNKLISKYEKGERGNCIHPDTQVKMKNGNFKQIKTIKINEILWNNNKVTGFYTCILPDEFQWINYKNNMISSQVFVHSNDPNTEWKKGYNILSHRCKSNKETGYHLITENGIIELEYNVIVRDFIETNDEDTYAEIELLKQTF